MSDFFSYTIDIILFYYSIAVPVLLLTVRS